MALGPMGSRMRRRELVPLIGGKTPAARPFTGREARSVVTDVGAWLRNLGLEQYELAFRKNARNALAEPDGGGPEGFRCRRRRAPP
jgi:hypothetical protein